MNKAEASAIADEWIGRLRDVPYASLATQVDLHPVTETVERNCVVYQVQVVHHWDSQPGGNVRVIAVDDDGIRAFVPFTSDFIKSPSGQFVGEESPRVSGGIRDRYCLTVNAKAAAALDLTLPAAFLSQADEVVK